MLKSTSAISIPTFSLATTLLETRNSYSESTSTKCADQKPKLTSICKRGLQILASLNGPVNSSGLVLSVALSIKA